MDTSLTQAYLAQRAAASHAVAGALAPKATTKNAATAAATGSTGSTGTSSTSSAATAAGTITSSDFLTLLVSELKNQDPTQPTDPNEYITQLAQVNSLEQLIAINSGIQQLDSSVPAPTTTTGSGTGGSGTSGSGTSGSGTSGSVTAASAAAPATETSHPAFTPPLTSSAASQIHKPS